MKVTKAQASENRDAILKEAAAQLRKRGFDQVSTADIAGAAGLTHGAVYSRYKSKDALKVDATRRAFRDTIRDFGDLSLDDFLKRYLSPKHRDHPEAGCPNAALSSEVWRQPIAIKEVFHDGLKDFVNLVAETLERDGVEDGRDKAMSMLATLVGTIALSRAIRDVDESYSDEMLRRVRFQLKRLAGKHDYGEGARSTSPVNR
ncbi:TetR/AcrR family transcriptional regulator [Paraburkholderia caribensis]|uniref:TetR/AcrR family transcriptional regulator n=1 Tax=Paraburkholderia caribensis TaxID=75105 RepID=UPI0034D373F2